MLFKYCLFKLSPSVMASIQSFPFLSGQRSYLIYHIPVVICFNDQCFTIMTIMTS